MASFPGNADYAAVQSAPVPFTIGTGQCDDRADLVEQLGRLRAVRHVRRDGGRRVRPPSGTVTFSDGGTPLATVALDGSGQATLTTSNLALGSHAITATYSGDADFLGVQSGSAPCRSPRPAPQVVLVPQPVFKKKKVVSLGLKAEIAAAVPRRRRADRRGDLRAGEEDQEEDEGDDARDGGRHRRRCDVDGQAEQVLKKTITIVYSGDADYLASTLTTTPAVTSTASRVRRR